MVQQANHSQLPTPPASAAARTYAQAVSGTPPPAPTPVPQPVDACLVLPSPASKASPVSPAMKQSASPTAQLRDDPRDAIIASLQLTMRAVEHSQPSWLVLKDPAAAHAFSSGIARALDYFPEQQTGFRRHRCTADSLGDVVSALEHARNRKEAALLVILDVKSAFDGLPHLAVEQALATLGVGGRMLCFVQGFLSGRFFRVRVGRALSSPHPVTSGVPQGSVLSPFLFNVALAHLPSAIPSGQRYPVHCSIYADDVALWNWGPTRNLRSVRSCLQDALNAVVDHIASVGLAVSSAKMKALLVHPKARTRSRVARLTIDGSMIPWETTVTYLGLRIDHRLSWAPAIKEAMGMVKRVQKAVKCIFLSGRGCAPSWALPLHAAAATARLLYALPLLALPLRQLELLELLHRGFIRSVLGLPRSSQVAATLAEAGAWPLSLLLQQRGLLHIDLLAHAPDGRPLLARLESRPTSRMGALLQVYREAVGPVPPAMPPPPPTVKPLTVTTDLGRLSKRRSPTCALQQAVASKLEEELAGRLIVYTDGSVLPATGSATAACVMPALGRKASCRLPFDACSTAAETAGLHLAVDLLAADPPMCPVSHCRPSRNRNGRASELNRWSPSCMPSSPVASMSPCIGSYL
ncbi:uncharacterized protein LOC119378402, partial [Rhipicephalus sanguineus]|uniref:uncharacterized protein LOC119378402 n=1 Tax=Rhipicephalus sanguineus TaxID=34632 RepID=UPI001895F2E9